MRLPPGLGGVWVTPHGRHPSPTPGQTHTQADTPEITTEVGGMHPTGMPSCF